MAIKAAALISTCLISFYEYFPEPNVCLMTCVLKVFNSRDFIKVSWQTTSSSRQAATEMKQVTCNNEVIKAISSRRKNASFP